MTYRLLKDESVQDGLVRIILDQLDKARGEFDDPDMPQPVTIHQVRKRFKKCRAALRLVRPALGERYKPANVHFRDLQRLLAGPRDIQAQLETIDKLHQWYPDDIPPALLDRERLVPLLGQYLLDPQADPMEQRVETVYDSLGPLRKRAKDLRLDEEGFGAISGGVKKTYRRGRKAMNEAFDTEDDDDFHEWRKRVKYHWYHVRLLQETSPAFMKARRTTMKQLSDCLGYDHDLAILKGFLDNTAEPILPAGEIDHVVEQIQLRQRALRHDAWQLGEKLYIEKPKALVKRLGGYWAAWKDTGQDE